MAAPARSELGSRIRYYLFAFLAFVLASEVAVDLTSGEASGLGGPAPGASLPWGQPPGAAPRLASSVCQILGGWG